MKMTRGELKNLVKECLVEVLSESFGLKNQQPVQQTRQVGHQMRLSHQAQQPKFTTNKKALNTPVRENRQIESSIKTGDPVMDAIFADTARTTLPTLLEADSSRRPPPQPQGSIERLVAESEPGALFGEDAAAKWADLAFGDFQKKV